MRKYHIHKSREFGIHFGNVLCTGNGGTLKTIAELFIRGIVLVEIEKSFGDAGFGIDFDLSHVASVGEGRGRGLVHMLHVERIGHARG